MNELLLNDAIEILQSEKKKAETKLGKAYDSYCLFPNEKDQKDWDTYNALLTALEMAIKALEQPEPQWNNHTVACLLADLFDDTCACNYNGIDEWLPSKCELLDSCPNPVGVACWEQFLKHRAERRTDG